MKCGHCGSKFEQKSKKQKLNYCGNCMKTLNAIEKDDIKRVVKVIDVLEHFNIRKSEDNRNYCCVGHSEKNPSMDIRKNLAHCYVCGFIGDVIQVYRAINGCDMASALLEMNETFCNNAFGTAITDKNRMSDIKRRKEEKQYEKERDEELIRELKCFSQRLEQRTKNYIKRIMFKEDISENRLRECHKTIDSVTCLQELVEEAIPILIFSK